MLPCCLSVARHEQRLEGVLRSRGVLLESKEWCATFAAEQSLKSGEYWLQGCYTSGLPQPRTVYFLSEHRYVYVAWSIRRLGSQHETE